MELHHISIDRTIGVYIRIATRSLRNHATLEIIIEAILIIDPINVITVKTHLLNWEI